MAFKPSKIRMRQNPQPIRRGTQIIPSAPLANWYAEKIQPIATAMLADYEKQILDVLNSEEGAKYYAMDASISSMFKKVLNALKKKWTSIFIGLADQVAPEFVERAEKGATISTIYSLSTIGIDQPKSAYNESIRNTLKAAESFNKTLITSISEQAHDKMYTAVMLSLTSPSPDEQGQVGIKNALKEIGIHDEKRIKNITKDQTSKLYSSFAVDRMVQNGIEEFEWIHSSAGKVPRQDHVAKDGVIFKLNDPRLWEGKPSDQGYPGWAINCRCRMRPIV